MLYCASKCGLSCANCTSVWYTTTLIIQHGTTVPDSTVPGTVVPCCSRLVQSGEVVAGRLSRIGPLYSKCASSLGLLLWPIFRLEYLLWMVIRELTRFNLIAGQAPTALFFSCQHDESGLAVQPKCLDGDRAYPNAQHGDHQAFNLWTPRKVFQCFFDAVTSQHPLQ